MAGSIEVDRAPLLRLLMIVFVLGMTIGGGQYSDRDRTVLLCTTLAAMVVLWFAVRAADGGGRLLRARRLLERLEVGLSAATCILCIEPVAGYIIASCRLGGDVSVAPASASVVVMVVALDVGVHAFVRGRGAARA